MEFQELLKIYLSEAYFRNRKIWRNARHRKDAITQAQAQLDQYIAEQDAEIERYLSNPGNNHYEIVLIFILSMFPHKMQNLEPGANIRGLRVIEFGGDSVFCDLGHKDGSIIDFGCPDNGVSFDNGMLCNEKGRRELFKNNWKYIQKLNMFISFIIFSFHFVNNVYRSLRIMTILMMITTILLIYTIYGIVHTYKIYTAASRYRCGVYDAYNLHNNNYGPVDRSKILMNDNLCFILIMLEFVSVYCSDISIQ